MNPRLGRLALAASVAALAGCGLGSGDTSEGVATLTVTGDFGSEAMVEAAVEDPAETETVLRLLDREAEITTRYGGGFVQSIEGVAGGVENGRNSDWFFYVNGIESPIGSADRSVAAGDRIWWDHRDWTDAMRVPAVVGSWPEPFLQASAGEEALPVVVECAGPPKPCATVESRLADAGVTVSDSGADTGSDEAIRVLVGPWQAISRDPAAAQIAEGPARSGIFARFTIERPGVGRNPGTAGRSGRGVVVTELLALDERAAVARRLGAGAGLVAAVRDGEDPPTWVISGVDRAGVGAAAGALSGDVLADRFAVIVAAGSDANLPIPALEGG